jgi:hypothetical protein
MRLRVLCEQPKQLDAGVAGSAYYADIDHLYFLNRLNMTDN